MFFIINLKPDHPDYITAVILFQKSECFLQRHKIHLKTVIPRASLLLMSKHCGILHPGHIKYYIQGECGKKHKLTFNTEFNLETKVFW